MSGKYRGVLAGLASFVTAFRLSSFPVPDRCPIPPPAKLRQLPFGEGSRSRGRLQQLCGCVGRGRVGREGRETCVIEAIGRKGVCHAVIVQGEKRRTKPVTRTPDRSERPQRSKIDFALWKPPQQPGLGKP